MFNTFRKLFGKRVVESPYAAQETVAPAQPGHPAPMQSSVRVDVQPRPAPAGAQPRPVVSENSALALPLRSVIARLPAELMGRVRQMDVGEAEVFVPMQKVLTQLPQGAVRISFGELRQAAPPGTFSPENDRDRVLVDLPLHEILIRVNAGLLARRPVQKHVEVPAEVTGPFGGQARVIISNAPAKPAAPARPPSTGSDTAFRRASMPQPQVYSPVAVAQPASPVEAPIFNRVPPPSVPSRPAPVAPLKPAFASQENVFKRTPAPAPAAELQGGEDIFKRSAPAVPHISMAPPPSIEEPIFKRTSPIPPPAPAAPVHSPIAPEPDSQSAPIPFGHDSAAIQPPSAPRGLTQPAPVALPAPPAEPQPIRFNPAFTPAPAAATPVAPAPQPAAPRETIFLPVRLADLSEAWPEEVRQEIEALGIAGGAAALPHGLIEAAMKKGKIVFPWSIVRSWIKPAVPAGISSPHDAVLLELPLKVVAPSFLAGLRSIRTQKKVSVDPNIPDLFSGTAGAEAAVVPPMAAPPQPPVAPVYPTAPASAAPAAPETNYYVWKEKADAPEEAAPVVKKGPSPGTSFLQRYATPNEIVSKAAALNGVGGALIALPDGLLVASKIPTDMNADTLAAFLPQIFGRVSQSTRELRMGELNNLNFTVGSIPWKIFRVGAIYFAAFGIAGQPLPTSQLAGIAAELDRKAK